ncbi:hypothetical protein [Halorhabdus rudnickae]|uniref:hypothetical protein n=1 Tax=Halorhabdus rudnickae TaxID=1775544 RepID=UPI0010826C94|nr:hypothetical protein [Halorhabdus rudnickae]
MVERTDPGSVGVVAGRVVGVLTTILTVAVLVTHQESFYQVVRWVVAGFGSDVDVPVWVLFWANIGAVAIARYSVCYVAGSLFGVLYDWLDRPGVEFVAAIALVTGIIDGFYGGFSAGSLAVGVAYVFSWLVYVPVFAWLLEDDDAAENGPIRLE